EMALFVDFNFSSSTTVLAAAVLLLVLYLLSVNYISKERGKEPPGPRPLPLLGNLLQIDLKRPYKTLHELSKTYGSVFTVYLGTNKVVVLAGYEAVREALVNYAVEFGERNVSPIFKDLNRGHGILFANGESWKELRRFALATLKDFGMGKRLTQGKILEECGYLIQVIEDHKGNAFDTALPINYATANIISSIVYGSRFDYGDPVFKNMVKRANQTICVSGSASVQLFNMFPRLFGWIKNRQVVLKNVEMNVRDIKNLIKHLKETLESGLCRGLVDCFLIRKQKEEDSCVLDTHYNEENLTFTVSNLFAAGTDTTAATLRWGLLLMAKYPHIQEQVHEELSRVVGSRQVCVDDRKNLPYTDAVIHETQRLANIVPMSVPHQTSQDVTFKGYFIKKCKLFAFAGRRMCLGEGLAKMELFLFFTSLIQRFRFTPPPGITEDELDLTPAVGFTTPPSSHMLCAVSRQ
uniref:Cytochrome P450 2K1-like n=1 Tax=Pundamilia nyererei TaxID=303518 RepID=A0A3B4ES68_9CICH